MALGASRRAIARQLLCETAILVAVASFLALAIARIGVPVIVAWAPQDIPRLDEVAVSLRAAAFTALAGAALALLCWVAPALGLDSRALDPELRTSGRGFSSGGFSRPARRLLVVGEIAVAVVVLVFTGLLYRSVSRLGQIDLGFSAVNLLAVDLDVPRELESAPNESVDRFYDDALQTIAGTPGVISAGAAYGRPLKGPFPAGDVMVRIGPGGEIPQIRARLRAINPSGVIQITPMAELVALHRSPWTSTFALFGSFAWLTAALAIVGLYAMLAVTVAERAREIGVRLALGAGSRRIVALVIGEGVRIALSGVAVGVVAAGVSGRLIRALLLDTSPFDPRTFAAAPIALVAVAIMACAFPALRATRIDPAISLRAE